MFQDFLEGFGGIRETTKQSATRGSLGETAETRETPRGKAATEAESRRALSFLAAWQADT